MKRFQYLIASAGLHALLILIFLWGAGRWSKLPAQRPVPVEVVYQTTPSPEQTKTFVTDPQQKQLEQALKKLEDQARFLSKNTQRVQREQVASRTGRTQNAAQTQRQQATPTPSHPSRSQPSPRPWDPPPLTGPGLDARKELAHETQQNHEAHVQLSESTINEYIPEVRRGGFTSLNTDQFLFYTFYARINEQVRNRWVQNLRSFMYRSNPRLIDSLARRVQTTELEVLLDKKGNFVRAVILGPSEDPGLDDAAAFAFRMAQPFNNPPADIVDTDGCIHLHYSFYVGLRPRSLAGQ